MKLADQQGPDVYSSLEFKMSQPTVLKKDDQLPGHSPIVKQLNQPPINKKNGKRPFKQKKTYHNQQIHSQQQQQHYDDLSDSSESDIPLDDIDDMLEEGLKESLIDKTDGQLPSHEERKKIVLKKREQDYFEMLPEGWIEVTHFSGMPVYLHKSSRVCTLAKPYYLGSGSTRKHEIPVSAIPCLAYRKELDKEKQQQNEESNEQQHDSTMKANEMSLDAVSNDEDHEIDETKPADDLNGSGQIIEDKLNEMLDDISPTTSFTLVENKEKQRQQISQLKKPSFIAKVETVKDNKKERSLNHMKVREYCEKLFEFQEITIRKFKTWADRRNHMQQRKLAQRPSLPEGTKLITCPLPVNKEQGPEVQGRNMRKEFVMNPAGKSSVCILHEFVQHAERVQPKYVFQELENANTPYSATVIINSMQYGTGFGSSKKQAKSEAAKATLEILIPDMKEMTQNTSAGSKKPDLGTNDLSFFDDIKVEDPRVSELCVKAGQHSPYQILVECLRRNCGMGDTDITTNVRLVKHQKNEFTMKVGSNTATVICRNKREGELFVCVIDVLF